MVKKDGNDMAKTICLRIDQDTMEILEKAAKHRRENISVFVRRSIVRELARLGYLSEEERRAVLWWKDND